MAVRTILLFRKNSHVIQWRRKLANSPTGVFRFGSDSSQFNFYVPGELYLFVPPAILQPAKEWSRQTRPQGHGGSKGSRQGPCEGIFCFILVINFILFLENYFELKGLWCFLYLYQKKIIGVLFFLTTSMKFRSKLFIIIEFTNKCKQMPYLSQK